MSPPKVVYEAELGVLFVYVDPERYARWKTDQSVPLVDVLDTFQVYDTDTGTSSGIPSAAGSATLGEVCGAQNLDDAIKFILLNGQLTDAS